MIADKFCLSLFFIVVLKQWSKQLGDFASMYLEDIVNHQASQTETLVQDVKHRS